MNRRMTFFALAPLMILLLVAEGEAQVISPVINYQGRAQDAAGQPLTGERAISIRIYGTQSGGAPIFSESHPSVTFNSGGVFTLVIGGNTPGGIPQSIGFDQSRWLGVTIAGFNEGNELPRLRFYGTSYSFEANHAYRADHADSTDRSGTAVLAATATSAESARYADSTGNAGTATRAAHAILSDTATTAVGLLLPAIQALNSSKDPTLRIVNGSGTALEVEGGIRTTGSPNAIIAVGVVNTSKHYSTEEVVGTHGTPDPGALYRDNVPLAWAQIDATGNIISDFGILGVSHTPNNPGVYRIELDNSVIAEVSDTPAYALVVTPRYEERNGLVFPFWDYASDQSGGTSNQTFEVVLRGYESGIDNGFSVVVFGRTEK